MMMAVRVSRAPIAGLASVGLFWGGFAALVPDIKAGVGATDAEFGTALIMSAVGGILSLYLSPRVGAALGRNALPLAGVGLFVAAFFPLLAGSVPALGLALFGMGAAVSMLDMSANVRISQLEERHKLHLMNVNHAMFSFAFAAGAFATSLARKSGFGAVEILPFVALGCLLLAGATIEGRGWLAAERKGDGGEGRSPWGVILPAAAILFAAFICENATEAWSALHIERTLGGAVGEGGFGPMMLGMTMGVGRLSGQFAAARLGEAGLILWSAALGVLGAVVIGLAPVQAVAVLGVGLLGLGVAVVVPSANSILGRLVHPDLRGFAISRAWMIGFTGFFIGPTAMGFISQLAGLRIAFLVVACVMATLIPWTRMLQKRGG